MAAALLAAGSQGLVTIKDVSLCFSQEEWGSLDPGQTDFYGEYVMQENCGIVVSLRFPIPKLDGFSQVEGGEDQWMPDSQDSEILRVTYPGDGSEPDGVVPVPEPEPAGLPADGPEEAHPWSPEPGGPWPDGPGSPGARRLELTALRAGGFPGLLCRGELDSLMRSHLCPQCGKSFVWGSHLARHLQTHTGERPYRCPKCQKSFGRRHHLVRHQKTHLREKPSRCPDCGKVFRCPAHLASHQRAHAEGEIPGRAPGQARALVDGWARPPGVGRARPGPEGQEGKPAKPRQVGEGPGKVRRRRAPPVERSHICGECGKSFGRRHHLVRHWLTHTGEKPFHCPQCQKGFGRKHHLDRHLLTHQGQSPRAPPPLGTAFPPSPPATSAQGTGLGPGPLAFQDWLPGGLQGPVLPLSSLGT